MTKLKACWLHVVSILAIFIMGFLLVFAVGG